jgi:ribonuclease Z
MSRAEIIFLGTSSMIPTKDRNTTSAFLSYDDKGILFDCGEGTQRQMKIAGIRPNKIDKILITHWHGDHVLGLPGLIQTLGNSEYVKTLEIYGPLGSNEYFSHMLKGFAFDTDIPIKVTDVEEGVIFENNDFFIEARKMNHGIDCLGYAFVEKDKRRINSAKVEKMKLPGHLVGKLQRGEKVEHNSVKINPDDVSYVEKGVKVVFITDTEICENAYKLAKDADLLVSEATYAEEHELKGIEYKHMTAKQAALLASNSNVKKLALSHFSGRYKTADKIEEEARTIFPDTTCAYDFLKIRL